MADPTEMLALADDVQGADLYRLHNDGRPSRTTVDWPWALAVEAERLGKGGALNVEHLRALVARVQGSEWATRWDDPGDYPSNAGAGPLPTRYDHDNRPHALIDALKAWVEATLEEAFS